MAISQKGVYLTKQVMLIIIYLHKNHMQNPVSQDFHNGMIRVYHFQKYYRNLLNYRAKH
jgi:hypothetical protein